MEEKLSGRSLTRKTVRNSRSSIASMSGNKKTPASAGGLLVLALLAALTATLLATLLSTLTGFLLLLAALITLAALLAAALVLLSPLILVSH
jgi:hypothetical protein